MEGNILKEWFLNINYNPYKIPTDDKFKFLCQGKIGPIWQEVINVFESRKKVDKIRLNLIYHGLKNNLKSTDLKPKQVELWNRKIELEENLSEIKQKIKETEKRLNAEVHNGKLKLIKKSNLELKNNELKQRILLSKKKYDGIRKEIEKYTNKTDNIQKFLNSHLSADELKKRVQLILSSLNTDDSTNNTKEKKEVTNDLSFLTMNDFFIQSQINGNGKKLMPLLKEHFTWMNTPVLNVLLELQKSSVQELSELNFLSKESGTQHFNTDMELLKLCTFINEIHFKTVHNQTEAERYEDLIKEEIFANIDENSKQYEYLTLKCTEIGNMAAIKCFQIEAKQLGIVNDEHSIQLETLTKRLVEIQSDIDVKKELIEKYYAEIRPYFESCFETQQALNKRYSTFKFNVENAFTNLSNDNFQNHVETMKFIDFPLQFSINEYQNIKNCWKVLLNSSELENLNQILLDILNTPETRPEIILIRLLAKKLNGSHETTNETTPFEDFNDLYTPEFFMDQNKELMIAESKLEFDSNSIELMSPKLEKLFEFWLRQNFKEVVSQSRFFDGKNCKYYEKKYDSFYDSLKKIVKKQI